MNDLSTKINQPKVFMSYSVSSRPIHYPLTNYVADSPEEDILSKKPIVNLTLPEEWYSLKLEDKAGIISRAIHKENSQIPSPKYEAALSKIKNLISHQKEFIDTDFKKLLESAENAPDRFKFTFENDAPVYLPKFLMRGLTLNSPYFARINTEGFKEYTSKEMIVSDLARIKFIKHLRLTFNPTLISIEEAHEYIESFALIYLLPLTPPIVDVILENIEVFDLSRPEIVTLFMNADPRLFNATLDRLSTKEFSEHKNLVSSVMKNLNIPSCSGKSILKALDAGIKIDVSKLQITELDFIGIDITKEQLELFKNNPHLKKLKLNYVNEINLKGFESLTHLTINKFNNSSIDLSHTPHLQHLVMFAEQLHSIDLSHTPNLQHLHLHIYFLETIDLSHTPDLQYLFLFSQVLRSIDLSHTDLLQHLDLCINKLTAIDLSHNPFLQHLRLDTPFLSVIDLSDSHLLQYLDLDAPRLTAIDLSHTHRLQHLSLDTPFLAVIDLKNLSNLTHLYLKPTQLNCDLRFFRKLKNFNGKPMKQPEGE